MSDYADTMKEFDVNEAKEYLASLNGQPPKRDTMKEKILELIPAINDLLVQGYTKKQIFDLLSGQFDLKITYGTFRTYLAQGEKGKDDDGDSAELADD